MNRQVEQVADLAKQHEARAEKLRALHALLADDPVLIAELRQVLFPVPVLPPSRPRVEMIVNFLRSKDDWQTARQIAEGTGLPRNTVNSLLFKSKHRGLFKTEMQGPKKKVWRLDDGIIRMPKKPKPVAEPGKMGTA